MISAPSGGFVVAWAGCVGEFPCTWSVRAQRFDGVGSPSGSEIVVAPDTLNPTDGLDVAGDVMLAEGPRDALGEGGVRGAAEDGEEVHGVPAVACHPSRIDFTVASSTWSKSS